MEKQLQCLILVVGITFGDVRVGSSIGCIEQPLRS